MKIYWLSLVGVLLGAFAFFQPALLPFYIGLIVVFLGYGIVLLHQIIKKTP